MKRKAVAAVVNPKLAKFSKKDTEEKQLVVIHWLRQNYYLGSGGSTPKALLFQEYLDMCQAENVEPTSNSAFGKLVRTAFPGVQSSRKGPRGAAKHQYKNLLPIALASGGERSRVVSSMGESEPSSEAHDEDEYDEEELEASSSFTIAGSSSSPVSSPQQASPVRHRRQVYESSPVSDESSTSSSSFYFSSAPGPVPSSPTSLALEDGDQLASSPTLSFSYSSSPSSSPMAVLPLMTHSAEWMPPVLQVVDGGSAQHHHCQNMPHHHQPLHELEEGAQSSFDDIIDAYGAEAAAAAEQGVWEGDDVEAFFSITTSPYAAASSFLMPSAAHGYASFGTDFGFVGANERREEEAQMMWCSGSSVEDILSANKGEEWIDNILQGCN